MSLDSTPRVLSIQSHVVHGYVGNKSAVFPLQVLGFEVDFINTVQFSTHTGYKYLKGTVLQNEDMDALIEGLTLNEVDYYTHFLTGYSRSPDSLKKIAEIINRLRQKNPQLVYVCDPVMGDNGQMYVPEDILPVYRDVVVPLADILTPNQFEAELITGIQVLDINSALKAISVLHNKGVKTVVLSSTDLGDEKSMIALASSAEPLMFISTAFLKPSFKNSVSVQDALYVLTINDYFVPGGGEYSYPMDPPALKSWVSYKGISDRAVQYSGSCYKIQIPKLDTNFTGTGDLFAALFLAWSHKTNNDLKLTLEKTISTLQHIVRDTFQTARAVQKTGKIPRALIELRLVQNKAVIENPEIHITAVEISKS